ncbi:MAG: NAD(P)/FAD-dependent oxidoreductase [Bacteroidota bacterium]
MPGNYCRDSPQLPVFNYIISRHLCLVNQLNNLVVIGGGAAGYFCAVNAARMNPNLQVIILERSSRVLQKVKVSGGGRCNVTHACFEISQMIKRYPRGEKFLKKAFHQFFTTDTIKWFEERGVLLKTETDGRMFPANDDSQTIIDCLLKEANNKGIKLQLNTIVTSLDYEQNTWVITTSAGNKIKAANLCIACGGFAKKEQFKWITSATNHTISDPVPSLFTFNIPDHPIRKLMGVTSLNAQVKLAGSKLVTEGPVLITHWGLSGPAILKLSAFAARELAEKNYNYSVIINWLPGFNENSLREKILQHRQAKATQKVVNTEWITIPQRLFEFLVIQSGASPDIRWADLPSAEQNKLVKNLCGYELQANGKTIFKEEFVTAGGIKLQEIEVNTMASKLKPQLYFAGEIIDVDGITGGYNFQNAWTTGFIAAKAIAGNN